MFVAFDTETHLIRTGCTLPKVVCMSVAVREGGEVGTDLMLAGSEEFMSSVEVLLVDGDVTAVAHNASFDLGVLAAMETELLPAIFKSCSEGRVRCTKIREKLLNLADTGSLDFQLLPDGSYGMPIKYSLADLVKGYFGMDISEGKTGSSAWRTNYAELDGTPLAEWPSEAVEYAKDDALWCLLVFEQQENRRQRMIAEKGFDPLPPNVEAFRVTADFCLNIMSSFGVAVDAVAAQEALEAIRAEVSPEQMKLLIREGILVPATPPRPHANGARNADGTPKMTAGTDESISKVKLVAFVERLAKADPSIVVKRTAPSDKFPEGQVSVDSEWLQDNAHLSPVLEQYQHRQAQQKMLTTELPRMMDGQDWAPMVHPNFDVLKETGRTSSFAGKLTASFNCQNVHPAARKCYVARPGHLLVSVDFGQMELVTLAQTCLDLFGQSVMADMIRDGNDLHAFLGAQIAHDAVPEFRDYCTSAGIVAPLDVYRAFEEVGKSNDEGKAFHKHYRKLAKPTGLGYPGGLGAKTFVTYAKATFGVHLTQEEAETTKRIWLETYPEMRRYLDFVGESIDPHHAAREVEGERSQSFHCYTTPLGMRRSRCTFCAAANGIGLQSPSAEGALLALISVMRACLDSSLESMLFASCRPLMFIHDEIVAEIPDDELAHERAHEIASLMVEAFKTVSPNVPISAKPVLMRRWDKDAVQCFDDARRLVPS